MPSRLPRCFTLAFPEDFVIWQPCSRCLCWILVCLGVAPYAPFPDINLSSMMCQEHGYTLAVERLSGCHISAFECCTSESCSQKSLAYTPSTEQ